MAALPTWHRLQPHRRRRMKLTQLPTPTLPEGAVEAVVSPEPNPPPPPTTVLLKHNNATFHPTCPSYRKPHGYNRDPTRDDDSTRLLVMSLPRSHSTTNPRTCGRRTAPGSSTANEQPGRPSRMRTRTCAPATPPPLPASSMRAGSSDAHNHNGHPNDLHADGVASDVVPDHRLACHRPPTCNMTTLNPNYHNETASALDSTNMHWCSTGISTTKQRAHGIVLRRTPPADPPTTNWPRHRGRGHKQTAATRDHNPRPST